MTRTDIERKDVFISWTGKDRALKDRIVGFLEKNGISCLESDYDCSGDFEQWSREAAAKCSVFLLVYTAHTKDSEYVPIEVGVFKEQDDWKNRLVPVVLDKATYDADPFDVNAKESAVLCENGELRDGDLQLVLGKVRNLVVGRLHKIYFENTRPKHIRLISLYEKAVADKQHDYTKLYIRRTLTEVNENGETVGTVEDAAELTQSDAVCCISGAAGSGKTLYLQQLREAAGADIVTVVLPCHKVADSSKDIFTLLYEAFVAQCGNRIFYSENNFKALLESRRLLLVLDGMDEISTVAGTRKMLFKVENFLETSGDTTTTVFTTRNEADAGLLAIGGKSVRRFRLNMLCDEDVRRLGENLFLLFGIPEKNTEFYIRVQDLTDEIKTNPLLLSQLAIVYKENGDIPKTVVGIYDAIADITFSLEKHKEVLDVPTDYTEMVGRIGGLLKAFAYRRYNELSKGKNHSAQKLFAALLKDKYTDDHKERAAFLTEYLEERAILVENEFHHKMFLEYFTAVAYYEQIFDDFDELENEDALQGLFTHYNDPYWEAVIKLFLLKADSLIDEDTTRELYVSVLDTGVTDYTLLLDTCAELTKHRTVAEEMIAADILKKSLDGTFPPYGPLFWYIPTYRLYAPLARAVEAFQNENRFIHAVALLRDLCWTCGHMQTIADVTDTVSAVTLFERAKPYLCGVRGALVELFLTGATLFDGGTDIYPRCFNVAEAKAFLETECGIFGEMTVPFQDELGLYHHTETPVVNDEYIGWVSLPYDIETIENTLSQKSCRKVTGLLLTPTGNTNFRDLSINKQQVSVLYIPENIEKYYGWWDKYPLLTQSIYVDEVQKQYYRRILRLPYGVTRVGWARENPHLKEVYLPDTVTRVDGWAFMECTALQHVALPSGLQKIGANAFFGCNALDRVQLPDGLQEIGASAFERCASLQEISLPSSLQTLGDHSFSLCTGLRRAVVAEGLSCLAYGVFMHCKALTEVSLPTSLTEIETCAFYDCDTLQRITIPQGVKVIGSSAFADCIKLTEIALPEEMEEIEAEAFENCWELKEFVFPRGIAAVADGTFSRCKALTTMTLFSDVEEIGTAAFSGCENLSDIVLPDTLTEIGGYAFSDCVSLTEIRIPDGVDTVKSSTFEGCSKLQYIRNLPADCELNRIPAETVIERRTAPILEAYTVPEGVTAIEPHAFENRKTLTVIHLPQSLVEIGENAFAGCKNLTKIEIPNGVTTIGNSAFIECKKLASVRLPAALQSVGNKAFVNCTSLKELDLPCGVSSIGFGAFEGCGLTRIHIPEGVTILRNLIFSHCVNLCEVQLPSTLCHIGERAFKACVNLEKLEIPKNVSLVDERAFADCFTLERITLPQGIDRISRQTFDHCEGLAEIEIPDGVTVIRESAFSKCLKLSKVTIPYGVTKIGHQAFLGCEMLAEISIPETVRELDGGAFAHCYSLETLHIPEGVKTIPNNLVCGCNNLRRVHLPQTITEILWWAFMGCKSLEEITIPDNVTRIGEAAFDGCEKLQTLVIPSSVRTLENKAFTGCTGLESVTLSRRFEGDITRIFGDVDNSIFHFI